MTYRRHMPRLALFLAALVGLVAVLVLSQATAQAQEPLRDRQSFEITLVGNVGSVYGYRQLPGGGSGTVIGTLDPSEFTILGATYRVIRAEQNRQTNEVLFAISPCPSSWEMESFEIGGTAMDQFAGRGACSGNIATWTQTGVTTSVIPSTGSVGFDLEARPLFVTTTSPGDDGGQRGAGLKDTICLMPNTILGEGACTPIAVFIPPVVAVAFLLAAGVRHPMVLSGVGIVVLTGMAALMIPGPIMIVGFVVASAGVGGLLLLLKR